MIEQKRSLRLTILDGNYDNTLKSAFISGQGPVKSFKSNRGANSIFDQTQKVVSRLYKDNLSTLHTSK